MTEEKLQEAQKGLRPYNEIVFAMMVSRLDDEYRELLIGDPHEFIFSWYNVEMKGDIHIVENDAKTMHLALPFYRPTLFSKRSADEDK